MEWACKRQTCTATSTTEAEVIATSYTLRQIALPTLDLLEAMFGRKIRVRVWCDNSAAVAIHRTGFSGALRHVKKTARNHLGFVHDALCIVPGLSVTHRH